MVCEFHSSYLGAKDLKDASLGFGGHWVSGGPSSPSQLLQDLGKAPLLSKIPQYNIPVSLHHCAQTDSNMRVLSSHIFYLKNVDPKSWYLTMTITIIISKHSAFSIVSQSREFVDRMNNSLKIIQGGETQGERDCSPKADSASIINSGDTFCWHLFSEDSPLDLIRKAKSTSYQSAYPFACSS